MARNQKLAVLLASVFATAGYLTGQEADRAIIRRTDAEKRRFVKDYLAAGAPLDASFWNGEIGDPVTGFGGLVIQFDWAQEATIKEIERLHAQSPRPDDVLYRLAHHLVGSGTIEAFEAIRKFYRDHPEVRLLSQAVPVCEPDDKNRATLRCRVPSPGIGRGADSRSSQVPRRVNV